MSELFDLESVFEADDYLYFYSDSLTDERSEREAAALVKLLELDRPMQVLDLACGFGRHANRLAALGHAVTGIDLIPAFIEMAWREAQKLGLRVDYRQADMRLLDFDCAFDRVLLLFTAFGYFSDEDNQKVLENVARALKPGGLLLFDIPNRDLTLKTLLPAVVVEKGADLMINRNSFDMLTGRWHNRRIVIRDGQRRDKPFSIRLYNPTEITALLRESGLEPERLLSDWDGAPLTAESGRMVVVARKAN